MKSQSFDNKNTNKPKFKRHKSNKFCKYCKKQGQLVDDCYCLKNKREKDETNEQTAKAFIVGYDSIGDILFVSSTEKGSVFDWILKSRCLHHMCPHKD